MYKIDKLIIKTFIGPFIATFFIALFAVVMQHFWKYVDDMVGKGIDIVTLLKMIAMVSISVGVLFALPIAVLLASLMTFGNLSESFELLAIKSSGISLLRFMRPIFVVVLGICAVAFLFNNYIIPKANLTFYTMLSDMRNSKPSFDLKAGEFYKGIDQYAILVREKNDDQGWLKGIVIYETANNNYQDNIIVADSGRMQVSNDKSCLEFKLYNGERVQERGKSLDSKTDFIRMQFAQYTKVFDISSLQLLKTNDTLNKEFYKALNLTQLNKNIDSLQKYAHNYTAKVQPSISNNVLFLKYLKDSGFTDAKVAIAPKITSIDKLLPDSTLQMVASSTANKLEQVKNQISMDVFDFKAKDDSLRLHEIEWHSKFTFSIICIVMLLIGAPMGAIVRRGGLGVPLLIAILFFVLYFIFLSIGQKSAQAATLSPFVGIWLPVFVLTPIGLFLVYKAQKDAQLFNPDFYIKWFNKIIRYVSKKYKALT